MAAPRRTVRLVCLSCSLVAASGFVSTPLPKVKELRRQQGQHAESQHPVGAVAPPRRAAAVTSRGTRPLRMVSIVVLVCSTLPLRVSRVFALNFPFGRHDEDDMMCAKHEPDDSTLPAAHNYSSRSNLPSLRHALDAHFVMLGEIKSTVYLPQQPHYLAFGCCSLRSKYTAVHTRREMLLVLVLKQGQSRQLV